uniref:Peptidase A2 domain-containing protein n=1 Tax=Kalanchoe fedtschenkoi TaxID=63787 RepID=A0A7N0TK87_KALFE
MAGNTDLNIAKLITAGFTGQLKDWWDNYLTPQNKDEILSTVKQEHGRIIENAVYTLVINIIEHFTGRISDNSENIRTLLQNLRCKTLTNFRWYKDTFLIGIGHYANKCRMKDKIKNLNLDEELKDSLKKLLINSESETELNNNSNEDEIYKLISQFKDTDSLNVLKGNDLIEFLQSIKDKELRSKVIESIDIPSSSETRQNKETFKPDNSPYMMSEVFESIRQKHEKVSETPTNVLDLKIEIDNLKDEIKLLKQLNNNLNQRVSKLENVETQTDLINPNEPLKEGFLSLTALVDSGADVSVIQEELIPTKYFEKTTHSLRHAGGEKLQIDFKLPEAYICNNRVCIPESFLLVKNITSQFITEPQTKILNEIKDIILQKYNQINFLKSEVNIYNIEIDLKNPKLIDKIKHLQDKMSLEICNDHSNAFWNRKKHIVSLPYEESFKEQDIPT